MHRGIIVNLEKKKQKKTKNHACKKNVTTVVIPQ